MSAAHLDAVLLEVTAWADAAEHEQVRRAVGAATEDHLLPSLGDEGVSGDQAVLHPGGFQAIEDQRQLPLTYFEFAALAALWCMREAKVDVALLEIGLGGRLDAFNAVDAHVAVITSIGLDHQAFLGETREAIGAEKAGILRRQQDVVLGADMPASVLDRAQALGLSPRRYGRQFTALTDESGSWRLMDEAGEGEPTSLGSIPPHNLALAVQAALFLTPQAREHVASAAGVRVPGRLQEIEYRDRRIILDVAHNRRLEQDP